MKIKAYGRYLLVKMNYEAIDDNAKKSIIALPQEVLDKEKGGCYRATIMDMGSSAFDEESPEDQDWIRVGTDVITSRYPGHLVTGDIRATDTKANEYRLIICDEVHGVVDEGGVDV